MSLIIKDRRYLGEDGRMYHFCRDCNDYKPSTEFNKCSKCPFGLHILCKEHHREQNRKQYQNNKLKEKKKLTKDDMSYLRISFPTENDYLLMKKFLEKLGYDTSKNIHNQFMERHNLNK
jgi:hypothetical protein